MPGALSQLHAFLSYFCTNDAPREFATTGNSNKLYRLFFFLDKFLIFRPILVLLIIAHTLARVYSRWSDLIKFSDDVYILNDTTQNFRNIVQTSHISGALRDKVGDIDCVVTVERKRYFFLDLTRAALWSIFQCKHLIARAHVFNFKYIYESSIYFYLFRKLFSRKLTKYAITSCDHSTTAAAFLYAARDLKIYSVYVQHGLVTEIFHPPSVADLSILFDLRSLKIYQKINRSLLVSASEIITTENFEVLNKNSPERVAVVKNGSRTTGSWCSVALVLNQRTTGDLVRCFIKKHLGALRKEQLTICPHPLMSSSLRRDLSSIGRIANFRDTKSDLYICGNTSSILDLLELGKRVRYTSELDRVNDDYYGLVRDGLVGRLDSDDDLALG